VGVGVLRCRRFDCVRLGRPRLGREIAVATYYMHLLDESPAGFFDGKHVCFSSKRIPLAKSLRQIKREQAISLANDGERANGFRYAYVTVVVPE
jgi:hypothetical protein